MGERDPTRGGTGMLNVLVAVVRQVEKASKKTVTLARMMASSKYWDCHISTSALVPSTTVVKYTLALQYNVLEY